MKCIQNYGLESLERPKRRWKKNFIKDFKDISWNDVKWIKLALYKGRLWYRQFELPDIIMTDLALPLQNVMYSEINLTMLHVLENCAIYKQLAKYFSALAWWVHLSACQTVNYLAFFQVPQILAVEKHFIMHQLQFFIWGRVLFNDLFACLFCYNNSFPWNINSCSAG